MMRFKVKLKPGQKAPDFSLPDSTGKLHSLKDYAGKNIVLFFYPADFTAGCTIESMAFRDRYPDFSALNAEVIGISGDGPESHSAFAHQHRLPYTLLSDQDGAARKAYTVPHVMGRLSGRSTFVVGPDGMIRYIYDSRTRPQKHVDNSLEFLNHAR